MAGIHRLSLLFPFLPRNLRNPGVAVGVRRPGRREETEGYRPRARIREAGGEERQSERDRETET